MKQDRQLKTKSFGDWTTAKDFAKSRKGFVEGPFFDYDISTKYIVFYR